MHLPNASIPLILIDPTQMFINNEGKILVKLNKF